MKMQMNRRSMIKKVSALGAGFTFLPSYLALGKADAQGNRPPSQRVNLACIGVGGIANGVIPNLCKGGKAIPVAFADVDFGHRRIGGKKSNLTAFPDVKRFHDFRVMLEKMEGDIDAVAINTPDINHFVSAILAMSMGKHVFVQKPLTYTFEESEILMRAEKKFRVVTQMGNQGHTSAGAEQFKSFEKHGIVKDIDRIVAYKSYWERCWWMNKETHLKAMPQSQSQPESLKAWDVWSGPRGQLPFSDMFHPWNWRGWYDVGCGMFGDWGAHIIDFAHHYLKLGLPEKITPKKLVDFNAYSFPTSSHIVFNFPERGDGLPAVTLDWKTGEAFAAPEGEERYCDKKQDGSLSARPKIGTAGPMQGGTFLYRRQRDYLIGRGTHGDVSRIYPLAKMREFGDAAKAKAPKEGHYTSFIEACMGNGTTESPFSVSGPLTQTLLIGAIAERLNEPLKFDRTKKRFVGNRKANFLLKGPRPAKDWRSFYKMA